MLPNGGEVLVLVSGSEALVRAAYGKFGVIAPAPATHSRPPCTLGGQTHAGHLSASLPPELFPGGDLASGAIYHCSLARLPGGEEETGQDIVFRLN